MPGHEKIKILFHLNQIGYGGTEKAILTFCQNLDRRKYTPYLYVYDKTNAVKKHLSAIVAPLTAKLKRKYHKKYVTPWIRLPQFKKTLGEDNVFIGNVDTLASAVNTIRPDIVHFNRGNWDAFFEHAIRRIPDSIACIETNIFGKPSDAAYLQRLTACYFVSLWLLNKSTWHGGKARCYTIPLNRLPPARICALSLAFPPMPLSWGVFPGRT